MPTCFRACAVKTFVMLQYQILLEGQADTRGSQRTCSYQLLVKDSKEAISEQSSAPLPRASAVKRTSHITTATNICHYQKKALTENALFFFSFKPALRDLSLPSELYLCLLLELSGNTLALYNLLAVSTPEAEFLH